MIMKNLKSIIGVLIFAIALGFSAQSQKISLKSGNLSFFPDITELNIEYDFSDFGVGKFKTEAAYTDKKVKEYNDDEAGRGDLWLEKWNADKETVFPRQFEELLKLQLLEATVNIDMGDYPDAEYTLILKTTFLEPGYNIGISRKNAFINVEMLFVKTDDRANTVALITMDKVPGRGIMGTDFDTGYRIGEAYAKAGKELAQFILKKAY
jgi:hypothetical protein